MFGFRPASDGRFSVLVQVGSRLIGAMVVRASAALVALSLGFAFLSGVATPVFAEAGAVHVIPSDAMPGLVLSMHAAPQGLVVRKIEAIRRMAGRTNVHLPQRSDVIFVGGSENAADSTIIFALRGLQNPGGLSLARLGAVRAPPFLPLKM